MQSTADAISDWIQIGKTIPTSCQEYLFPGTTIREKHLSSNGLSTAIRKWVRRLERLDSEELDANGDPVPFDRSYDPPTHSATPMPSATPTLGRQSTFYAS